jgi:ferredoxin
MPLRYLKDVATLQLNGEKCIGCGMCAQVCVHGVFAVTNRIAHILDRDACMECGACAMNCPVDALTVRAGVGCAYAVWKSWFQRKKEGGAASQACS